MSSTPSDAALLDKLESLLDGDFKMTFQQNWLSGHHGWMVTFTSNSSRSDKSQELRAGDVDFRAALNRACEAHNKFVADEVVERLSR